MNLANILGKFGLRKTLASQIDIDKIFVRRNDLRSESSDGIPTRSAGETSSTAALVSSLGDVVQDAGVGIDDGVDETDRGLANVVTGFVDQGQDASERGTAGAGAVDESPGTVDCDDWRVLLVF